MAISEAPWSGDASQYSDSQYEAACALDRKVCGGKWTDAPAKSRCSLPIKTPQGTLSRAGVHAAASRIGSVTDACPKCVASAKSTLRSAYKTLGEDIPPELGGPKEPDADDKTNSEDLDLWQVTAGQPRHGEVAIRAANEDGAWVFREASGQGQEADFIGILGGHFSVFNRWTEINNMMEGNFMEAVAPGAFSKTFNENRPNMRCLFNHGKDVVGMQPLGPILDLGQDETGARYEVGLLDTSYNRDLLPGLQHGLFGASFRFQVLREDVKDSPARSDYNPKGLEERMMTEVRVREFGPVTFGQYAEATAGLRSLNEELFDMDMAFRSMNPDQTHRFLSSVRSGVNVDTLPAKDEVPAEEVLREEEKPAETPVEDKKDAPSEVAPPVVTDKFSRSMGTLPMSAARKSLRTSRDPEEPKWKL